MNRTISSPAQRETPSKGHPAESLTQTFEKFLQLSQSATWKERAQAVLGYLEQALEPSALFLCTGPDGSLVTTPPPRSGCSAERAARLFDLESAAGAEVSGSQAHRFDNNHLLLTFPVVSRPVDQDNAGVSFAWRVLLGNGEGPWLGILFPQGTAFGIEDSMVLEIGCIALRRILAPLHQADAADDDGDLWHSEAYGPEAMTVLEAVSEGLMDLTSDFMSLKWDQGISDTNIIRSIANLTGTEITFLKASFCAHLQYVLEPSIARSALFHSGRTLGWSRVHVGAEAPFVLHIHNYFRSVFHDWLDQQNLEAANRYRISKLVDLRLQDDVLAQIEGHECLRSQFAEHTLRRLPEPMVTWAAVLDEEIRVLGALPGIQSATLIRMGSDGNFRIENASGPQAEPIAMAINQFWCAADDDSWTWSRQSKMASAWQTGQFKGTASLALQYRGERWMPFVSDLQHLGVSSNIHIPIPNEKGRTVAVLTLMGIYPNQFETRWAHQWIRNLQQRWAEIWRRCAHKASAVPQDVSLAYRERLFSGGLEMYVQPIVDLSAGQCCKVEALARLVTKKGKVISPGVFIPLLGDEELDRLFRLGLEQSLAQLVRWDEAGLNLDLSLNLPPSTMLDPDCPLWIERALQHYGIKPSRLTLELLETEAVDGEAKDLAIERLLAQGIKLAMDDLGSGYSSLQRLANVPFETIKVDQSLLAHIYESPSKTLGLVSAVMQMGIDFGHQVVVEGLEDEGMIEAAIVLGARFGQGYGIARPMPMGDFMAWQRSPKLPVSGGSLKTPLGALAFHWRATRRGGSHGCSLQDCPVTPWLDQLSADNHDVIHWHRLVHSLEAPEAASKALLSYLEQWVKASTC